MAWQTLDTGLQLDAPRLAVALVQSEAEMLHSPAHDVSSFLRGDRERWRLESFTERTFDGIDKIASTFDCVIIGFNATCHQSGIREVLEAGQQPPSNLLILHQKAGRALDFLRDGLAIDLEPLEQRAECAYARERREQDELLLNWPRRVVSGSPQEPIPCAASFSLRFDTDTAWRTVLEVEDGTRRVPVMVRTSTTLERRLVVCSAWLDPRDDEQHARLLENAIAYCAQGRPEIAVVAEDSSEGSRLPPAALLARKLRLQGSSTVEIAPESGAELYFNQWPLCQVSHVVLRNEPAARGLPDAPGRRLLARERGHARGREQRPLHAPLGRLGRPLARAALGAVVPQRRAGALAQRDLPRTLGPRGAHEDPGSRDARAPGAARARQGRGGADPAAGAADRRRARSGATA